MTLDIRPTQPDHPQVLALIEELDAFLRAQYEPEHNHIIDIDALKDPSVTFLAAWSGDAVVGCGAARAMPGEPATDGAAYGEIKRMFVPPARRGERIGQRVLAALEAGLQERGIDRALLETGEELAQAVRLYRASGYGPRGAFGGYPDNGMSLFMEKRWMTA